MRCFGVSKWKKKRHENIFDTSIVQIQNQGDYINIWICDIYMNHFCRILRDSREKYRGHRVGPSVCPLKQFAFLKFFFFFYNLKKYLIDFKRFWNLSRLHLIDIGVAYIWICSVDVEVGRENLSDSVSGELAG